MVVVDGGFNGMRLTDIEDHETDDEEADENRSGALNQQVSLSNL